MKKRQIFLDIACFFIGEKTEFVIHLWEALGCRNPRTAIVNLSLKSLIRVEDNHMTMHDHLRDLGREIVAEESRDDPYKRSRLWQPDHLCRVLGASEEVPNLRGFKWTNLRVTVPEKSLAQMKNLSFLWLENVQLAGQGEKHFPPNLKWLRLRHCSRLKRISFNMQHVNELKYLNVFYCERLTELEGLGALKSLTELELVGCGELELPTLPRGLVKVRTESCSGLKKISFNMPHMNELKYLNVLDCERLTELQGLGSLKSLTELMLQGCRELAELSTLSRGLVKVGIESCSGLKRISFNLPHMNDLKVLNVFHCERLTELEGLGSLKSLTELMLMDCGELVELPTLPRGLVKARIESCSGLKRISFNMPHMNELKFLNVFDCERLTELQGLGSLKSLTELMLQYCGELVELPTLPRGLVKARIESCSGLQRISFNMSHMNELKVLNVFDCERLTELQGLGSLKSLTELMLQDRRELAELPTLPRGLLKAQIESCSGLKRISFNMSHMNELKLLNVFDCERLTELQGLGGLKSLTVLDLSHCENISELSGLESLESLTDLNLKGCKNVKSLAGMEVLKSLKRLIVNERGVCEINVQQWIQGLSGLQVLCLSANGIPKWLERRMQTMPQPAEGACGKYCVLEDTKCTGIVFCLWMMGPNYGGLLRMNISTEEDTIYREFPLPDLSIFDGNEQHVGILQEEIPSIIKFRSGDIIGCSPATLGWGKVQMVGVHLQLETMRFWERCECVP
eukprot:Gb_33801 [translate_table: standard]